MSELAPSEVVELLDADVTVEKRASWEAFEFTLLGNGDVEVVNTSHEEPEEHTYTVHVEGGIPSDCTCPAFEYQNGACKHMVAVAIREPVLGAASDEPKMKADGGVTVEAGESDHSDERPDDCDCGEWNQGLGLSCWPCYRDGFEEPNPNVGEE
ncbi:SWIM zinc finger family protein [Halorientalis regularis]|uniref:SWIM zinc finger n=1 Tax=Halorientalis regularis TaxID=660518 RepID=A0A1G7QW35_9EURY|nr:SWIM zinc finger family protein [Halorientalis regularis]SDG02717.1 SWIM zinc finger [Halorientalis regularis]